MPPRAIPGQLGIATPFEELVGRSETEMNAEFADYAKLGVDWLRTDFRWHYAQPDGAGGYTWAPFEKLVDAAVRYDIKVVAILHDPPDWIGDRGGMNSPANVDAFGKFAEAAAVRFKGKVQHWEIGNEQNLYNSQSLPDVAAYTQSLKSAYRAIKSVDPQSIVISGGLSPVPKSSGGNVSAVEFLQKMYASGAGAYFDALGYHPYSWPLQPDDPASWNGWKMMKLAIRETMVENGDAAKQIWITEMGAPTKGGAKAVSEQAQAYMLQKAADLAHSYSWAGPLMWYSYKDRGGDRRDTENWFGLIRPDGTHKPIYKVFQDIAKHETADPSAHPIPPRKPKYSPVGDTGELNLRDGGTVIACSHVQQFVTESAWVLEGRDLVPRRGKDSGATCIQGIASAGPLDPVAFDPAAIGDPGS
ncbi:hypothetical protein SAE02_03360 [Skermanella aerolata]|uniref:Glycoside hydrolase family 5 domain-containing protein n=1 Tax=Skermanella aerolata TaxID=393310 RepID=A0A512DI81_9PROT|nr:family 1 glycosylhydrolase [Skermanella aerolata]KJB97566.1 beta-galactosidase [Skermanella aerolata KACC 11604]GEO36188.1 hypothetical protein SAE02_03360 [Skermanella aerolata]